MQVLACSFQNAGQKMAVRVCDECTRCVFGYSNRGKVVIILCTQGRQLADMCFPGNEAKRPTTGAQTQRCWGAHKGTWLTATMPEQLSGAAHRRAPGLSYQPCIEREVQICISSARGGGGGAQGVVIQVHELVLTEVVVARLCGVLQVYVGHLAITPDHTRSAPHHSSR